jgi:hypothetical protein
VSSADSESLSRIAAGVLGDCAFLLTEPVAETELQGELIHASIDIRGDSEGRLVLSMPRQLALLVAADMLAISSDDPEADALAEGTVAELANVLVGVLIERFCAGQACHIGLPSLPREPLPASANTVTSTLLSDTGDPIRVAWTSSAGTAS